MLIWQAHRGKIDSAAFSPDGRLLVTATGGVRTPYLWEPTTGQLVRKLAGASGTVKSVCFARDARLFAAGTTRSVCLWNVDTWSVIAELSMEHAHELAFGPGETPTLAASSLDGVGIWEVAARDSAGPNRRAPDRRCPCRNTAFVHFSPDGALLATSTYRTVTLWRTGDAKQVRTLRDSEAITRGAVRFAPDGQRLAFAHGRWVEIWALPDGTEPMVKFIAGTGRNSIVWAVNWTADGRSLLTAGNDGCVRLWDAGTGTERKAFDWKIGKLYCAAFSPDGLTCAACSDKGQVVVWDVDE
jgi:WD40 repeat protein